MTVTSKLANHFVPLKYKNLDDEMIKQVKYSVLDNLGGALAGINVSDVLGSINTFTTYDNSPDSVVWGTDKTTSVLTASLLNGISMHALEMDDFHPLAKIHMGTVVIPAALTLGSHERISGQTLIESIVAGYETGIRLGMGVGTASHRLKGWHSTCTIGMFGVTMAASKILNLGIEETINALGISGTQSSGLWAFIKDGASNKKLHGGHAAESGIRSALLAKSGMTGSRYIIESDDGGFYPATSDSYNVDVVTNDLSSKYWMSLVGRKPYASCRSSHLSIDGILAAKNEDGLKPEEIKKIDVYTYEIGVKQCGIFQIPNNTFEAKFSIPYSIAVALYDNDASVNQYSEDRIHDKKLKKLASKINVHESEKYTAAYPQNWGCELVIEKIDGSIIKKEIWNGKGSSDNPLTYDELVFKFKSMLTATEFSDEQVNDIIHCIDNLEKLDDVSKLTDLLILK